MISGLGVSRRHGAPGRHRKPTQDGSVSLTDGASMPTHAAGPAV